MPRLESLTALFPNERFRCNAADNASFESDDLAAFRTEPASIVIADNVLAQRITPHVEERFPIGKGIQGNFLSRGSTES